MPHLLPARPLAFLALASLCVLIFGSKPSQAGAPVPIAQGQLAFLQVPTAGQPEVAVIDLSGDGRKQLTSNDVEDAEPAWSPDGKKLAEGRHLHDSAFGIIVMNADGSNPHQVGNDADDDGSPSWTPDGRLLLTSYRDGGFSAIFIEDADGGNAHRLSPAQQSGADYKPVMSPDGSRIAFISERDSGDNEVWVMDADGSNPTRLTFEGVFAYSPTWASDGSTIYYSRDIGSSVDIWAIDPDGSNHRQITFTGNASDPAFSPTGEHVAFTSEDGIDIMTPDGQNVTHVPNTDGHEREPAWRPSLRAGDSDCDGNVGVLDVLATLKAMAGAPGSAAACLAAANVTCIDGLDSTDVLPLLAKIADAPSHIPAGCKNIGELLG